MELRRRSVTPRKSATSDPYAQTARRSSRQASTNGSHSNSNSMDSTNTRQPSHAEKMSVADSSSPDQANGSGERAAKRRRLSASERSQQSHESLGSASSQRSLRSTRRDEPPSPLANKTPSRSRRSKRLSQSTLDEIIVNTDDQSPRGSAVTSSETGSPTANSQQSSQAEAEEVRHDGSEAVANREHTVDQNGDAQNTDSATQPVDDGVDGEIGTQEVHDARTASTDGPPVEDDVTTADSESNGTKAANQEQQPTNSDQDDPSAISGVDKVILAGPSEAETSVDAQNELEPIDQDTLRSAGSADLKESGDQVMTDLGDNSDPQQDSRSNVEDDEVKVPEVRGPQAGIVEDVEMSDAESTLGNNDDASQMTIPKVVTTTASPLQTISEEDNDDVQSVASAAAGELVPAGPGKPARRLPGRRRAPHANPKVEAALRRQLQLRVRFRAVAKALKPVLTELAKRNLKQLKADEEAHLKAREYEEVKSGLDDHLQVRLAQVKQEQKYNSEKLALLLQAETERLHMRYRQRIRNVRTDMVNRLKLDFLLALRKHNAVDDEEASDDDGDDIIPSLYHINVHGRRKHVLPLKYDSRSRRILETERLFNELSERGDTLDKDLPEDLDPAELQPLPFTWLDPTHREVVQHDRNLAALISVLQEVTEDKPKPEDSVVNGVLNKDAVNLQVLASASASNPVTLAPAAGFKPSMAALLNSSDVAQSGRPAVTKAPLRDPYIHQFQHAYSVNGPRPAVHTASHGPQLLPAFGEPSRGSQLGQAPIFAVDPQQPNVRASQDAAPRYSAEPMPGRVIFPPSPAMRNGAKIEGQMSPASSKRRDSQNQTKVKLAPKGFPSPDKQHQPLANTQIKRENSYEQVPVTQPRPPEQRPLPSIANELHARNRSVSESIGSHGVPPAQRQIADPGRPLGAGVGYHDAYGKHDPFRRQTISSADAPRQYSPYQSSVPPHLQRQQAPLGPPSLPSLGSAGSPADRHARLRQGSSPPRYQPQHPPPQPPPPQSYAPMPTHSGYQPIALPPMSNSLPPPPPQANGLPHGFPNTWPFTNQLGAYPPSGPPPSSRYDPLPPYGRPSASQGGREQQAVASGDRREGTNERRGSAYQPYPGQGQDGRKREERGRGAYGDHRGAR